MKRIYALLIVLILSLVQIGFAAPVTIIDPSGQDQITVEKGAFRGPVAKGVTSKIGSGSIYTGACRVQRISMYSDTAGDYIGIYDTGAALPEFEIGISSNTASTWIDAGGAPFSNGITVCASDTTNTMTTVVYDY